MAAKAVKIRTCARQIELFRDMALGNFRDLLVAVAKDVAIPSGSTADEHEGEAAGELRARDHGAVQDGRRELPSPTSTPARACSRLEPVAGRLGDRRIAALRVHLHPGAARRRRKRSAS
jgi:hypothetical protein